MMIAKKRGIYESNRIIYVPVENIEPNPAQPRKYFDREAIAELAGSIKRYGVLQPLSVRKEEKKYILVSGERRLRASKLAGLRHVPCIVLDVDLTDSSVIALVENLHRRDLDFIEEAEGLSRLISDHHLSQEEVARKVGKTQSAVANKLRILKLPGELLYIIRENGLTQRHARALLKLENDNDRVEVLKNIIDRGLNVAKTEQYIDEYLKSKSDIAEKSEARRVYVIKDVRLFLNTVVKGMDIMKRSGINAQCGKRETDTDIILTIKIPKAVS